MTIRIYFAGPLFTEAEKAFNAKMAIELRALDCEVFLPQESELQASSAHDIFKNDVAGIDWSNIVVANMDGPDPDSGTCWECGYAYAKGIPTILYRTDIRREAGELGPFNLMMHVPADTVIDARDMRPTKLARTIVSIARAKVKE